MDAALQIAVDLEQLEIRLGTERVRLLPVAGDVFCLNDARGPLVRALKFEERSRLLAEAGDRDVASLVGEAALVSSGVAADELRVAASLALAGGGEKAPAFHACAEFVEQRYGWDEQKVAETMALVIDRLCSPMVQQDATGWKQIVFQKRDADLGTLISQMATNLSQRAVAHKVNPESETTQTHSSNQNAPAQRSHASSRPGFESQDSTPTSHGSTQSVASASSAKRIPFRVLALNKEQSRQSQADAAVAPVNAQGTEPDLPAFSFPKSDHVIAPRARAHPAAMSTSVQSTKPTGLPAPVKSQSDHVNFSLSPAATQSHHSNLSSSSHSAALAGRELPTTDPFVATLPSWQPFATSSSNTQSSSELGPTNPGVVAVAAPESQSSPDWLAELAQLLEAECDMRGIDP